MVRGGVCGEGRGVCCCGKGEGVWFGMLCTGEVILHCPLSPLV